MIDQASDRSFCLLSTDNGFITVGGIELATLLSDSYLSPKLAAFRNVRSPPMLARCRSRSSIVPWSLGAWINEMASSSSRSSNMFVTFPTVFPFPTTISAVARPWCGFFCAIFLTAGSCACLFGCRCTQLKHSPTLVTRGPRRNSIVPSTP